MQVGDEASRAAQVRAPHTRQVLGDVRGELLPGRLYCPLGGAANSCHLVVGQLQLLQLGQGAQLHTHQVTGEGNTTQKSGHLCDRGKKRVYGQFSIETIHERRKRNREFSGFFFLSCLFE